MTHIQHPQSTHRSQSTKHVTVQQSRRFIKSRRPILTRAQVAEILGVTPIQVDRKTKAGMYKRVDLPGVVGYDMFENGLDQYVQLVDEDGYPLE